MSHPEEKGLHCYVSGRVQGVFFRAETEAEARRLGLTGWVRNLPDGRVEVKAFGPPDRLDEFHAWLRRGPPRAQVARVDCQPAAHEEHAGFYIARTPAYSGGEE